MENKLFLFIVLITKQYLAKTISTDETLNQIFYDDQMIEFEFNPKFYPKNKHKIDH